MRMRPLWKGTVTFLQTNQGKNVTVPLTRRRRGSGTAPAPQRTAGTGVGVFAVPENHRSVDDHIPHAGRVLMRLLERGAIGDRGGIEDDDVGEHAGPEEAALFELEVGGGKAAHPVNRL